MSYTEEKIYHLKDYVEYVTELGKRKAVKAQTPPVLWFRGHFKQEYQLRPSLFRMVELNEQPAEMGVASGRALQEEMRYQHYIAKNYHFLNKNPDTKLNWLELMQHHSVKTRLLDWSESMFHPLIFALESFFDGEKYTTEQRIEGSPNVWVFEPVEWNRKALEVLVQSREVLEECIDDILCYRDPKIKECVEKRLYSLEKYLPNYLQMKGSDHLEGIFNLSIIEKELKDLTQEKLLYLLTEGEYYYCLFYVLYQVYLTTKLRSRKKVLPLAIVESYHSDRIRAQRGAFTIFPYYKEDEKMRSLRKAEIHLDAMENMPLCNQYLHKIRICNQDEIAFEIMNAGLNTSWLYPEMPVVSNAIENREVIF